MSPNLPGCSAILGNHGANDTRRTQTVSTSSSRTSSASGKSPRVGEVNMDGSGNQRTSLNESPARAKRMSQLLKTRLLRLSPEVRLSLSPPYTLLRKTDLYTNLWHPTYLFKLHLCESFQTLPRPNQDHFHNSSLPQRILGLSTPFYPPPQ